jgi:hypothetical protein
VRVICGLFRLLDRTKVFWSDDFVDRYGSLWNFQGLGSALCWQGCPRSMIAKSEIAPPSTEVKSDAISNLSTTEVVSKMAAWLGQAQAANLYSDKTSAVDASRSARDLFPLISSSLAGDVIRFHESHSPCGSWCR